MIEREIAEFGRRMGMPAFSLSPAGLAALDVERLGRLHLELAENAGERELLVYLARAVPEYDVKAPRRVLERCHYRHARSEERRVGKECAPMCRSRWSPYH